MPPRLPAGSGLSDRELHFRDFNNYVSKYRRVLEMFDAVKVALTATPALHTALGDPLMPYEQRVERALQRILASRSWSKPQRDWLQRIANQTKAITIVDREALDDDLLFFKRESGGWPRLNHMFGGELDGVLQQLQREAWAA
jgi:hypothetical protein